MYSKKDCFSFKKKEACIALKMVRKIKIIENIMAFWYTYKFQKTETE